MHINNQKREQNRKLGEKANLVSTRVVPDGIVKLLAKFNKDLRMPATFLGKNTACSNQKARELLGWIPRTAEKSIVATAQSMFDLGLIIKK